MNHTLNCKCQCEIASLMRSVIPIQGVDFVNLIMVDLKKGERVGRHTHKFHTALYYPADSEKILIEPVAGMVIYLPPGTPHEVPAVKDRRVSVAMLVDKDNT